MQERRPFLATECDDLQKAEKFRRQIIGEVSRKVAQIQNGKVFSHLFGFRCLELKAFECHLLCDIYAVYVASRCE